ncbi:glycosyltransferase family 39 protein [Tepidimonas sp.]|uniref:glycosyltransferase family 39 protein n=1 Tax=Tepidimonas sp. TaxID=2002775 RepID=UPI0028CEAE4D|nr:glycosyltransferase family 39 protein [Tepidimonas sp.]MDT7928653.1 glycosyltransferase family 39 protein [Tepidimonas sp.]
MIASQPTRIKAVHSAAAVGAAALFYLWHWLGPLSWGVSLHVDEAQYWTWSRELAWGYYSKPPVIAALMAASTHWGGDGWVGVKALPLLMYPLAAGVMGLWVAQVSADAVRGLAATLWVLASPLLMLLGFAATTDAPLLLCWALATVALWSALQRPGNAWRWMALGAAWAIGVLSKYTMLAFLPGALLCLGLAWPRAARVQWLRGLLWAGVTAGVLLAPHLLWSAQEGWVSWRHTAAITVQRDDAAPERGVLAFVLGQALLIGPAAWLALRWRAPVPAATGTGAARFLLALHLPLLAVGVLQAARGGANINWAAPALIGLLAWLALVTRPPLRVVAIGAGVQALLVVGLIHAPHVAHAWGGSWPTRLDFWARMRGWAEAWAALDTRLPVTTAAPVVIGVSRDVLALGQYHWRERPAHWRAWHDEGPPRHHYGWRHAWGPTELKACGPQQPPCWLVATDAQADRLLATAVGGLRAEPLATVTVTAMGVTRSLYAWQLRVTPLP